MHIDIFSSVTFFPVASLLSDVPDARRCILLDSLFVTTVVALQS